MGNNKRLRVFFYCDYCNKLSSDRPSHYKRKKRHFCNQECYSSFRKEKLPLEEQHAYKGIRKKGESKQIYHRRYCENNPERISHLKSRRYAREKGAIGSHTLEEWGELKDSYDNKCVYCCEAKPLTKDHVMPLSEGGSDFIDNIQPLCRNCNSKKWKHINPDMIKEAK